VGLVKQVTGNGSADTLTGTGDDEDFGAHVEKYAV